MRYKQQPSATDKCLDSTSSTITYFRKRPIALIVLAAVLIWIIIVFRWSGSSSTELDEPQSDRRKPPVIARMEANLPNRVNPNEHMDIEQPPAEKSDAASPPGAQSQKVLAVANKIANAKKVLVTYGQNCCTAAKVC